MTNFAVALTLLVAAADAILLEGNEQSSGDGTTTKKYNKFKQCMMPTNSGQPNKAVASKYLESGYSRNSKGMGGTQSHLIRAQLLSTYNFMSNNDNANHFSDDKSSKSSKSSNHFSDKSSGDPPSRADLMKEYDEASQTLGDMQIVQDVLKKMLPVQSSHAALLALQNYHAVYKRQLKSADEILHQNCDDEEDKKAVVEARIKMELLVAEKGALNLQQAMLENLVGSGHLLECVEKLGKSENVC